MRISFVGVIFEAKSLNHNWTSRAVWELSPHNAVFVSDALWNKTGLPVKTTSSRRSTSKNRFWIRHSNPWRHEFLRFSYQHLWVRQLFLRQHSFYNVLLTTLWCEKIQALCEPQFAWDALSQFLNHSFICLFSSLADLKCVYFKTWTFRKIFNHHHSCKNTLVNSIVKHYDHINWFLILIKQTGIRYLINVWYFV